ncbi:MAG: hypothetical protein R2799_01130 [Crocinitomicaceae bacterium]
MKTILRTEIEFKDYSSSLEELTIKLYSSYIQRDRKSVQQYTYTLPELPSGYEASVEGKFNSELQTPIVHKRCYREFGSRGGYTFYLNVFKVEEANFEVKVRHPDFSITIECPSADFDYINEFIRDLNQENINVGTQFKIDQKPIKNGLTYQYFNQTLDNIKFLSESFEFPNDFKPPVLDVNSEDRKEVIFTSTDNTSQIKVIFWRDFQPNNNRNYSGLVVEIDQTRNPEIPRIFQFFFHHHDSHAIGQIDLTVDRCTLVVEEFLNKSKMKNIEIALQTYLIGIGAL